MTRVSNQARTQARKINNNTHTHAHTHTGHTREHGIAPRGRGNRDAQVAIAHHR